MVFQEAGGSGLAVINVHKDGFVIIQTEIDMGNIFRVLQILQIAQAVTSRLTVVIDGVQKSLDIVHGTVGAAFPVAVYFHFLNGQSPELRPVLDPQNVFRTIQEFLGNASTLGMEIYYVLSFQGSAVFQPVAQGQPDCLGVLEPRLRW